MTLPFRRLDPAARIAELCAGMGFAGLPIATLAGGDAVRG